MVSVVLEYARLSKAKKEIETQLAELKESCQRAVEASGGKLQVGDLGTLSLSTRKNWSYPRHVEEIADALKYAKKNAEIDGEATFTESPVLTFRS